MALLSDRDWSRCRVAVTGADGFIGRQVVARLHETGVADLILVRGAETELRDQDAAFAALEGASHVIHLAAKAGGLQFQAEGGVELFRANVAITRNVLRACIEQNVRRVFLASSAVVYSQSADSPLSEDAPTVSPGREPVNAYAWSKLTDEAQAAWHTAGADTECVVGRFTNIYGPGSTFEPGRATVVQDLVRKAVDAGDGGALEVWGDGTARRDFLHVSDAARAVLAVLAIGERGATYNIAGGASVTVRDLAELVVEAVEGTRRLVFVPSRPSGPQSRVLDGAALRKLSFKPLVGLREGVAQVVAAYSAGNKRR